MENKNKGIRKQSFVQGAFVLMLANVFVKLIGAIFKIPLKNLIGGDGMGIFNTAYTPYAFLLTLATVGIPVAVSRMTAEAGARGRTREIRRIFYTALLIASALGILLCAAMFIFAKPFVQSIPNTRALYAVMAFAPALFFGAVTSAYRGYYQGMSDMRPTAISQVIEASARLVFGYAFAYIAVRRGCEVEIAAAAAIAGVVLSTVAGMLYILLKEAISGSLRKLQSGEGKPKRVISSELWSIALPVTIASGVMSLTNIIDMFVIQNRLQSIGYTEEGASALYGIYETMCVSLMNLPQTLIAALTVSLIPVVAAASAGMNRDRTKRTVASALRLVSILVFPCAVGMVVLAEPILGLLFHEDAALAAPLLRVLSCGTVFISFVSITNAVLQAIGKERLALYSMLSGAALKFGVNYFLIGTPSVGISGAPVGTVLCYGVIMAVNFIVIYKNPAASPRRFGGILKPALAAALMGAFVLLIYPWLSSFTGQSAAALILIPTGAALYLAALITLGGIKREDVVSLPKGEKIAELLRLHAEN